MPPAGEIACNSAVDGAPTGSLAPGQRGTQPIRQHAAADLNDGSQDVAPACPLAEMDDTITTTCVEDRDMKTGRSGRLSDLSFGVSELRAALQPIDDRQISLLSA